jgi:hypothetical protein
MSVMGCDEVEDVDDGEGGAEFDGCVDCGDVGVDDGAACTRFNVGTP